MTNNIELPVWFIWLMGMGFGCCIGSFLNVCVYRLPREQSLVRPASRCPHCKRSIAWYDNIPLLSFLLLGGKCRRCRKPISLRYPLIELLTGLATTAVFLRFDIGIVGWIYTAFVAGLIAASFVDLEFQIIPDEISLGGLVIGLAASFLFPALHGTSSHLVSLGRSVIGMLVGGGILYGTGIIGDIIFRKESMGGGDIKLLAMAGSILGWKLVLLTFFMAPVIAVLPGLLVLMIKRSHVIPYGPFLSISLLIVLFEGNTILRATGLEETFRILWEYRPWFR